MKFQKKILGLLVVVGWLFWGCPLLWAAMSNPRIDALVSNADAYSRHGNHIIALNLYNQAIRLSPGSLELYYKRAGIFGKAGQYVNAIKDLNRVINQSGLGKNRFPHAIRFRADCFVALGYMQRASQDYLAFLRKAPKDGKVWFYLAETYALMGRKDLALQAVNKGLATGSHWSGKLTALQMQIMTGKKIIPHKLFSN